VNALHFRAELVAARLAGHFVLTVALDKKFAHIRNLGRLPAKTSHELEISKRRTIRCSITYEKRDWQKTCHESDIVLKAPVPARFSTEVMADSKEAEVIDHTEKTLPLGRIVRAVSFCLIAAALCAGSALADSSQYTYTGNAFTTFSGGYSCPTTCSISGSFTYATIGPDNVVTGIIPESWSFTDGTQTFNTSNSSFLDEGFATNSAGIIDEWAFEVLSDSGPTFIASGFVGPGSAFDESINTGTGAIASNSNQGTWAVSRVPEPSELLLLGVGLMSLISLIGLRQSTLGRSNTA
jgi:hypothetical protein